MQNTSYVLAALLAGLAGCSDVDSADPGQMQEIDARVAGGAGGGEGGAGGGEGGAGGGEGGAGGGVGGAGGGVVADLGVDQAVPDADPVPEDQGVIDPADAGPIPEPLLVAVVLTEQPQAETVTAAVSVTEPMAFPDQPGCVVERVDPDAPATPAPPSWDAGEITVSGLSGGDLVFTHQGQQYAESRGLGGDLFDDGATITVTSAGSPAVDAFQLSAEAPTSVNISSPSDLSSHGRDSALTVNWNASGGDSVLLTVFPVAPFSVDAIEGNWIFCGTDDSGQFDIPSDVLQQLPTGLGGQGVLIAVTRFAVAEVPVGADTAVISMSTSGGTAVIVEN